jgi:signal transduction histidine kinase
MEITLSVEGAPGGIDQGTGLTVYRIVQEGLTNSIKPAGPRAKAQVRVRYGTDTITVDVVDDGRGAAADETSSREELPGHGLIGMRERVELHGGSLVARPAVGGGFEVHATLPRVESAGPSLAPSGEPA